VGPIRVNRMGQENAGAEQCHECRRELQHGNHSYTARWYALELGKRTAFQDGFVGFGKWFRCRCFAALPPPAAANRDEMVAALPPRSVRNPEASWPTDSEGGFQTRQGRAVSQPRRVWAKVIALSGKQRAGSLCLLRTGTQQANVFSKSRYVARLFPSSYVPKALGNLLRAIAGNEGKRNFFAHQIVGN
jgi:hypothetical protein